MNSHGWLYLVAVAGLALVGPSGCAAAQRRYAVPAQAAPNDWSRMVGGARASDADLTAWWASFKDPMLIRLIDTARLSNFDIRTAVSRVREARATAAGTKAARYPSATLDASTSVGRTGSDGGTRPTDVSQSYSAAVDASWAIDVFGGTRSSIDSAVATLEARGADLQDVQRTVEADVASQYVRVRSLQQRLLVATRNQAAQRETWELTGFRAQAGLGTTLEVEQAKANLESTAASAASLRLDLSQAIHALAILLGQPPAALDAEMAEAGDIPHTDAAIALGVPAETLRRRPDVRAAERTLAARSADVNVARAALYPTFSLAGSIGLESVSLARWLLPGAGFWRLTPSTSVSIFNRRQLRENVVVKTETQAQAFIGYESAVASALRDVEDALVALAEDEARRDRLTDAVASASSATEIAQQLYNAGLKDFRDVLDAQRTLLSLEDSLTSSRANLALDIIALYRALGGGWR